MKELSAGRGRRLASLIISGKNITEEQIPSDIDAMLNDIASNGADRYLTPEQVASYKEELVYA